MKRLISLTAAIALMISIINISVFADTESSTMTNKDYYSSQFNLVDKYCDGDITFEQYQEQSQAVTNEYVNSNTVGGVLQGGALNASNTMNALASKIGSTVNSYGDEAREYISDWWNGVCNKRGVPTETTQTSNMDMRGFGALAFYRYPTSKRDFLYYCQYIVIYPDTGKFFQAAPRRRDYSYHDGSYSVGSIVNTSVDGFNISDDIEFYGDVRYADGTPYPTNDEYTYGTLKKYDEMTEKQLENLAKDFSDKMTLENPDLSNLEGLLNAIYARLGMLDSDDDEAMLSAINAAIIALASDNNANSALLLEALEELKETMKNGTETDLDPILKELKDISKSLDYLKTINTIDLIGDTIENLLELTDNERTFLDTYATLIINLTSKLGYKPVTALINSLEAVMFNGTPPDDIVISIYDTEVVILSTSSFESLQITETLNLAKMFVSVLLAISWLYSMRKKITGGA